MEACRITCGGSALSLSQALLAFEGAPEKPGEEWRAGRPPLGPDSSGMDERLQDPQSGIWIGGAAFVQLRASTLSCCRGPGIKVHRGRLDAQDNTIAYSTRGANVVVNGGHVVLTHNEIKGAHGDGVASWNKSHVEVQHNRVHANSGAGIAINSSSGTVAITDNSVYDNTSAPVVFATSQTMQATVRDNHFHGNATSGLQQRRPSGFSSV